MMNKDWFKYWFNSHHYLLLYQNRNEEEAYQFFNLIKQNIPLQKEWKIIDFCCGYGRLSKIFAKEGYQITGIDLSEFFINRAKEIFEQENLVGDFRICDVRSFNENEKYHLGINFFTSFGYFSDAENDSVLKSFCNSIVDNGWIVLDYFNPEFVKNNLIEKEKFDFENSEILIERKIENNRVIKSIKIKNDSKEESYLESVRIYSFDDFELKFNSNGFMIEKVFGDYQGNPLSEVSPRMIIFSQKR